MVARVVSAFEERALAALRRMVRGEVRSAGGHVWYRPASPMSEGGWMVSDTVFGTVCAEEGRFRCYRRPSQTAPCGDFDTLEEAMAFMEALA